MPGAVMEKPETGISAGFSGPQTQRGREQIASARIEIETGPTVANPLSGKFLTFLLGHEEFAIRVLQVKEIMGIQDITAVPQTPAYVKGVINLRGKVVPVVDLRLKVRPARGGVHAAHLHHRGPGAGQRTAAANRHRGG